MAPAAELVALGLIPSADFADMLHPGQEWTAQHAARLAGARQHAALDALAHLSRDDIAALLEAVRGS